MKKSNFIALVMGTISCILFSLGMCMALVAEWNKLTEGIVFGSIGLVLGLITIFIWRKLEHKAPIKLNLKTIVLTLYIIISALILGFGMCFCMVWNNIIIGTIIGLVGIVMLLSLIPLIKGFK